jgi:hypothetical protein
MTAARAPRPLPRWRQLVFRIAAAVLRAVRRQPRPLVTDLGLPSDRHPESLTRELPAADEEWLAGLAAELWPERRQS